MSDLEATARALVAEGKGILAADESTTTIKKRFDSIGVESTEETRRAYRDLLFTTEGAEDFISGVILYDETSRQSSDDGTPFPKLLESKGIVPGIKVDKGAKDLANAPGETVTEGLDGLRERLAEYDEIVEQTLRCFYRHVPAAVPGIVFLSGGQSDEDATARLSKMNELGPHPWQLSFSYGRALQAPALKAWEGKPDNVEAAQLAYYK